MTMSTPDSSTHAAETVPKKRRRSEAPPGASSTGPWAASNIGVGGAFSMVSHDVTDRFGRRMYLATQGSARAWVSADALPQRLVLEYATAGTVGGTPARCQNAACARPLRRDAPSKYCCRACGLAAARRLLAARIAAHARHADGADLRAPRAAAFTPRVERAPTAAPTATGASAAPTAPVSWLADVERERAALEAENARLAQQLAAGRAELEALRGAARVACTDDGDDDSAGTNSADAGRKSGSGFYQCPLCLRSLTPAAFVRHVTSCYETVCDTFPPLLLCFRCHCHCHKHCHCFIVPLHSHGGGTCWSRASTRSTRRTRTCTAAR